MDAAESTQHLKRKHAGDHAVRAPARHQKADHSQPPSCREKSSSTERDTGQRGPSINADVAALQDLPGPGPAPETGIRDEEYFRKLYTVEPDFGRLGRKYPEFGALLTGGSHLDFTDPGSVMQLTKTLLAEDFGLRIELPPDRLCPPVPNRHNYILWLKDLLDSSSPTFSGRYEPERQVTGLDIGTGASLIYPLLGCAQRPWTFIATDIDSTSLKYARANARINNMESRMRIVERTKSDALIPVDDLKLESLDFVMVNPPFYSSDAELAELAAKKSQPPNSACTGAPNEMVCEGGEVAFVQRLIDESLSLKKRVQWYTAMLGKQSSLEVLIDTLRSHQISNYAVTAFIQGNKTRRWALGWSFADKRPSFSSSRGADVNTIKHLPHATEIITHGYPSDSLSDPLVQLGKTIDDAMKSLDLNAWAWDAQRHRGIGFSHGNVWSRAYRRKKARENLNVTQIIYDYSFDASSCSFGFSVTLIPEQSPEQPAHAKVVIRWLQGDEYPDFESFAGIVRTRLRAENAAKTGST